MDESPLKNEVANPVLSIITAVYGSASFLPGYLDSLDNQDSPVGAFEVIAVEDGSPDNSGEILDRASSSRPWLKVIHQKNQGVSAAWNNGILNACGQYIMFVDGDDAIEVNCVSHILKEIAEHNPDCICFGINRWYNGSGTPIGVMPKESYSADGRQMQLEILRPNSPYQGFIFGKVVRADLLKCGCCLLHPFDPEDTVAQDEPFWIEVAIQSERVLFLTDRYYKYRFRPGSSTVQNGLLAKRKMLDMKRRVINIVENSKSESIKKYALTRYLLLCASSINKAIVYEDDDAFAFFCEAWRSAGASLRKVIADNTLSPSQILQMSFAGLVSRFHVNLHAIPAFIKKRMAARSFTLTHTDK